MVLHPLVIISVKLAKLHPSMWKEETQLSSCWPQHQNIQCCAPPVKRSYLVGILLFLNDVGCNGGVFLSLAAVEAKRMLTQFLKLQIQQSFGKGVLMSLNYTANKSKSFFDHHRTSKLWACGSQRSAFISPCRNVTRSSPKTAGGEADVML